MRILLTGGTGFVGRHLLPRLAREHEVIAPARGELDLASFDAARLPARVDAVIHAGGVIDAHPAMRQINVEATRAVCDWASRAGAERFLFVSTGGVYGGHPHAVREDEQLHPSGEYATTKAEGETIAASYRDRMSVTIARIYFPYGPGQRGRFIPNLARRIAAGEPLALRGNDGTRMSVTYIDDMTDALLALFAIGGSHTVNVAGDDTSVREIAVTIGEVLQREPQFTIGEADDAHYLADTTRLRELTGFRAAVPLREGLRRTLS